MEFILFNETLPDLHVNENLPYRCEFVPGFTSGFRIDFP